VATTRWAVIGGGLLGLDLARRLARDGARVTLFEAAPELGGLSSAWRLGDVVWDRHYHVTLLSDAATRAFLADLGLERELRWVRTQTALHAAGTLSPMSDALDYLRLPVLGLVDKLRLALFIVRVARIEDWRPLEDLRVEDWLVARSGRRVFERVWRPLLRAKLGDAYASSAATFLWATIRRLYAARRSGLKTEMFGYVPGGYARTLERCAAVLTQRGVELLPGTPVRSVTGDGQGWRVTGESGAARAFDAVVVTAQPRIAARLCTELTAGEKERLGSVPYQGLVCASLLLPRPLGEAYLTYLLDDGLPFTAVVEMTAFVDPAELGGRTLVYLPKYVASDDALFEASDDGLRASFADALERLYPAFRAAEVEAFRVSRVREVFPIPTLGHSRRVAPFGTSRAGLYLVNSSQIVNGTLNVNDTLLLSERAAPELLAHRPAGRAARRAAS
jgi:protoporphyrinogen oxidase